MQQLTKVFQVVWRLTLSVTSLCDPLAGCEAQVLHHSFHLLSVLHNQRRMSLIKQVCYFRSVCLFLLELIPSFHSKFVPHTFMMALQRCWCFPPVVKSVALLVNVGSTWNPCPRFRKCLHAKQNAASLTTLYSSHEYWSIQLLLKLLCWFSNCHVGYFLKDWPYWALLRMVANITCSTNRNISILNGNRRRWFSVFKFIPRIFLFQGLCDDECCVCTFTVSFLVSGCDSERGRLGSKKLSIFV